MTCQGYSSFQLLTPVVAEQDFLLPLPPMKVNASFDALPENDLQNLSIPEIRDDKINASWTTRRFLRPKVGATKRKRMVDDMILKMADQGETKLDFFNRVEAIHDEGPKDDGKAADLEPCKEQLGYGVPANSFEVPSFKRQRAQNRRNSNNAVCA